MAGRSFPRGPKQHTRASEEPAHKKWTPDRLDRLLRPPVDVQSLNTLFDAHHRSPLFGAVSLGLEGKTEELLRLGANPNTANEKGITVLAHATKQGNLKLIRMLIEAGANVNKGAVVDGAILGWHYAPAELLLANGAKPSERACLEFVYRIRNDGDTQINDERLLMLILQHGGRSCMATAVYRFLDRSNLRMLSVIYYHFPYDFSDYFSDVLARTRFGFPLALAARTSITALFRFLLEKGAAPTKKEQILILLSLLTINHRIDLLPSFLRAVNGLNDADVLAALKETIWWNEVNAIPPARWAAELRARDPLRPVKLA